MCGEFVISRQSPCVHEPDASAEMRVMLAVALFINVVLSDGPTGEASFLSFQVFHFLLNMSLKLRTCARLWRPRPSPVHLWLAAGEEGEDGAFQEEPTLTAVAVCPLTLRRHSCPHTGSPKEQWFGAGGRLHHEPVHDVREPPLPVYEVRPASRSFKWRNRSEGLCNHRSKATGRSQSQSWGPEPLPHSGVAQEPGVGGGAGF